MIIERIPHSQAQKEQAKRTGHIDASHRRHRRKITTHAIDNVAPDVMADRDDGVFVELKENGDGYKVNVTIADVAAHVPLGSELARVAHERAFTRYRPEGNDRMFPKELEERMSLEHNQERLGLSVVMELDCDYQLKHTAFEPVIATPDNVDYEMAKARATDDPQFQRMSRVAAGIIDQWFGVETSLLRDALPIDPESEQSGTTTLSPDTIVATFALLANQAVASFAKPTGLPFIYRNYDGTNKDAAGIDRSYYATQFTSHRELEKAGLTGAYCHFTSPIRRGADFYNAHVIHYVISIVDKVKEELQREQADYDPQALWDVMPELLRCYHRMNVQPSPQTECDFMDEMDRLLPSITSNTLSAEQIRNLSKNIYASLQQAPHLQLKVEHLQEALTEINVLDAQERDMVHKLGLHDPARQKERENAVAGYNASGLQAMDKGRFSSAIRNCALTGLLPEVVRDEALKRIQAGNINTALDAMHVMVTAHAYQEDGWRELKKAMASVIKHDSGIVNNVLTMANYYGLFEEGGVVETSARMPVHSADKRNHSVQAAILYTYPDKQSPPYYSLGHDERAALTHARYSFIEKYAFGELQPLGNSAAPNLLYAGLGADPENKEVVLRSLVEGNDAQMDVEHRESNGEHMVAIKIEGGVFPNKVTASAHANSEAEAKRIALRKILRQPAFMKHVQSVSSEQMHTWLHPQEALEKEVAGQGWQMRIDTKDRSTRGKANFECSVKLFTDSDFYTYTGYGINKSRAINTACARALIENPRIDIAIPDEPMGMSWIDDAVHGKPDNLVQSGVRFTSFKPYEGMVKS